MKPLYLYIENFTSHEKSEIDFSAFSAALVVGKVDNNDLISNGVGKTSIFRAIEYALFNQVRDPLLDKYIILEKLIRDETAKTSVIFDFIIDNDIYRIIRSRNRKGISELLLYKRNSTDTDQLIHISNTNEKLWDNLTSRRTPDTEADLAKLIKTNYKSFISTSHFMQGDMTGLATATPEKRRQILKEALELLVYALLEKIAKKRADDILKEITKDSAVLNSIGDPDKDIEEINKKINYIDVLIVENSAEILSKKNDLDKLNETYTNITSQLNVLEAKSLVIITKKNDLFSDVSKLEKSITEYTKKRKIVAEEAKALIVEISSLKETQTNLSKIDFNEISVFKTNIDKLTGDIGFIDASIALTKAEIEELKIPLPDDGVCKHCRQPLTDAHRRACMEDIKIKIDEKSEAFKEFSTKRSALFLKQKEYQSTLKDLERDQKLLNDIMAKILSKEKEIIEKKKIYEEHNNLIEKFVSDLSLKKEELDKVQLEVESSSEKEIIELRQKLIDSKKDVSTASASLDMANKGLNELNSRKAVYLHSIEEKVKDIKKKNNLEKNISELENKYTIHPIVIKAFDEIPDMIIENVLEDLQEESNKLLIQIRPGLQLSFNTEKTKDDGTVNDTLEINYYLNNKPRDYSQLSGAQRLCIAFSLKLGLSFLLAKMLGSQIKFLLLDEIDQSLDKAGVDAFADIIKIFQKDFTILVITHNDRLKDKFNHAILVEQDQNMVSHAKVVSSW